MTRFVVDAGAVLHMAGEELDVAPEHELQADALVTLDAELGDAARELVAVADIGALGPS